MAHPNKSLRHWLVAAICCGLAVGSVGIPVNAGGVFFTPVAESLGVLRGTFSMHATLTLIGTAVISLFMPAFMRKYPLKLLLFVGVTMAVGSTIMMGAARSLPIFFILGTLRGIGAGLFSMVPVTMILNEWFEKHHGLVTSVVFSFTGVAGAVFSPLLAKLIESVGWQTAYIVMGLLMLAACAPALLFSFSLQPQKDGFLPYGDTIGTEEKNNTSRQPVQTGEIQSSVFFLLLGFGVLHTAITGIPQHFPGYAETIRYGTAVGGVMLSAAMLGNIGFKLLAGWLSDRIGTLKATISMIVLNALSILALLTAPNAFSLVAFSFLFGTVYSVPAVGITLLTREFFGTVNYGKVYPGISFALSIGGAFSLSLVGYVYDFSGSYVPAFLIALVFHALNIFFVSLAAKQSRKQQEEVKAL